MEINNVTASFCFYNYRFFIIALAFLCIFNVHSRLTFLFQKIDVTNKAVTELLSKSTEYLQPNPGRIGTIGVGF